MERSSGRIEKGNRLGYRMDSYTRYLATTATAANEFKVQLFNSLATGIANGLAHCSSERRYSPIMPAFLTPEKGPPPIPKRLESVGLLFANSPYKTLGNLRGHLRPAEQIRVYFTEGLASIVLLDFAIERMQKVRELAGGRPFEFWPLKNGKLDALKIIIEIPRVRKQPLPKGIQLALSENAELSVYVEQISASLMSLWASYGIYFPSERKTLPQIATLTNNLIRQHARLQGNAATDDGLCRQKKKNAIVSALVEISGALSYAVTQGTSGGMPVLWNRSPFPHHSLLGVGGAVRALTKYTRYLESAFMVRDASNVIENRYAKVENVIPARIPDYGSGPEYEFFSASNKREEHFDAGGDFREEVYVPLIAHFSLRHGFMEQKFYVT